MKNNDNKEKKIKMDKSKFWTRVVAGILAGLMVLGFGVTAIMALIS